MKDLILFHRLNSSLCNIMLRLGVGEDLGMLALKVVNGIVDLASGGEVDTDDLLKMNLHLSKAIMEAPENNKEELSKMYCLLTEIFSMDRQADMPRMQQVAIILASIMSQSCKNEQLAELIPFFQIINEAIVKYASDGSTDMKWLYNMNSTLLKVLGHYKRMDENTRLLWMVAELLPKNGSVDMKRILELNLEAAQIMKSTLIPADVKALEKLYQASARLTSIINVYPNELEIQAGLLDFNYLVSQHTARSLETPTVESLVLILVFLSQMMVNLFKQTKN